MLREHQPESEFEKPSWQRWAALGGSCALIGVIWLSVLPKHSATEASLKKWEYWDSRGIDPAATYYSELECHSAFLANWKRRRAEQLKDSAE